MPLNLRGPSIYFGKFVCEAFPLAVYHFFVTSSTFLIKDILTFTLEGLELIIRIRQISQLRYTKAF